MQKTVELKTVLYSNRTQKYFKGTYVMENVSLNECDTPASRMWKVLLCRAM